MTGKQKTATAGITGAALLATVLVMYQTAATTYHVGSGQPYTMQQANDQMQPGDVCVIHPGSHIAPNPSKPATGGKWFTYIGSAALTDTVGRSAIIVAGGSYSKPYVSIKGVTISGTPSYSESADRCSLAYSTVTGSFSNQGADYTVFDHVKFRGPWFNLNKSVLGSSDGVRIYASDFPYLGQGQTGVHDHIHLTWDADSTVVMFNRFLITVEAGLDGSIGGEWHFGDRNRVSRGNETRINLKRACYAVWRWRSNSGWGDDKGCFNNTFDRDQIVVTGVTSGSRMLASSSANPGNGGAKAQSWGMWDAKFDSVTIDCGPIELEHQGGMTGFRYTNSTLPKVYAFDIHGSEISDCRLAGFRGTDEYSRPIWVAGSGLAFCRNTNTGGVSLAPKLAAVTGGLSSNCGVAPPPPPPEQGANGQPCRPGGLCDAGLVCIGGACSPIVPPPPPPPPVLDSTVTTVITIKSGSPAVVTVKQSAP